MSEESAINRRKRDRNRYIRSREERKAYQRMYYLEHREAILARKRRKALESPRVPSESRSREDIYHDWYLRHREAHKARAIARYHARKKDNGLVMK